MPHVHVGPRVVALRGIGLLRAQPDVDAGRIGGLGLSTGADVLIDVGATRKGLKAIVADGANPDSPKTVFGLILAGLKRRIAAGSGTTVQEVNRLLKQFDDMSAMMKRMNKLGQKGLMRGGLSALLPGSGGRRPY